MARWVVLALLAPALTLSAFGGMSVHAHSHHDNSLHVHVVGPSLVGADTWKAEQLATRHDAGHRMHGERHGVHAEGDDEHTPHVVTFSIPHCERLPIRVPHIAGAVGGASPVFGKWLVAYLPPASMDGSAARSTAPTDSGPLHVLGSRSRDRLVRTSAALLI